MNITGNVGANDLRGLSFNTLIKVNAPCAVAQQAGLAQTIASGSFVYVQWDTVWYDTWNGFNLATSGTAYKVQLPGVYLLMAVVAWPPNATGDRQAWFEQNGTIVANAEQTGSYATYHNGNVITAQIPCATNDLLTVRCDQTSGSTLTLSTVNGGCMFAVIFLGI